MNRILYLAAGSKEWGLGHLKRSAEIIALLRQRGCRITSVAFIPRTVAQRCLIGSRMKYDHTVGSLKEAAMLSSPRVIVDIPTVIQKDFIYLTRSWKSPVVALDWYERAGDFIIERINLRGGVPALKLAIIRRDIVQEARKYPQPKVYDVVILLGGRDHRGYLKRILPLYRKDTRFQKLKTVIVVGPLDPMAVTKTGKGYGSRVHFFKDPADLAKIMASARIGISNGGTSLMEFTALGVPTLVFPQSPEEVRFSRTFISVGCSLKGAMHDSGLWGQVNALLTDRKLWLRRSRKARALIDGKGAERIVARMMMSFNKKWEAGK